MLCDMGGRYLLLLVLLLYSLPVLCWAAWVRQRAVRPHQTVELFNSRVGVGDAAEKWRCSQTHTMPPHTWPTTLPLWSSSRTITARPSRRLTVSNIQTKGRNISACPSTGLPLITLVFYYLSSKFPHYVHRSSRPCFLRPTAVLEWTTHKSGRGVICTPTDGVRKGDQNDSKHTQQTYSE